MFVVVVIVGDPPTRAQKGAFIVPVALIKIWLAFGFPRINVRRQEMDSFARVHY